MSKKYTKQNHAIRIPGSKKRSSQLIRPRMANATLCEHLVTAGWSSKDKVSTFPPKPTEVIKYIRAKYREVSVLPQGNKQARVFVLGGKQAVFDRGGVDPSPGKLHLIIRDTIYHT